MMPAAKIPGKTPTQTKNNSQLPRLLSQLIKYFVEHKAHGQVASVILACDYYHDIFTGRSANQHITSQYRAIHFNKKAWTLQYLQQFQGATLSDGSRAL